MTHIRNITLGSTLAAALVRSAEDGSASADLDLINALGLGDEGAETPTEGADTVEGGDEVEAATKGKRTEIKIVGTIGTKKVKGLPAQARSGFGGGKKGSKYPFESLVAPVKDADGDYEYDSFTVLLADVENADAKKLQGAIQAATAAQNKIAKDAGSAEYYVSRTETGEAGEYVGSSVYRVDNTIAAE